MTSRCRAFVVSFLFSFLMLAGVAQAEPLTAEVFGEDPFVDNVVISPTGEYLAVTHRIDGRQILGVYDLFATDPKKRVKYLDLDASRKFDEKVGDVYWVNDRRIAVMMAFDASVRRRWFVMTRLLSVDRDLNDIHPIPKPRSGSDSHSSIQHSVMDMLPEDPDHVLMVLDRDGYGQELNVYKVDVNTGGVSVVEKGGKTVAGYVGDQQGRIRLKVEIRDSDRVLSVRMPSSNEWEELERGHRESPVKIQPVMFDRDPNILLVRRVNSLGYEEIHRYDLTKRAFAGLYYGRPKADVMGLRVNNYDRSIMGASYEEHYPTIEYMDPMLKSLQQSINQALPDTHNQITSFDRAKETFVIFATGPRHPGIYYIFQRSKGTMVKFEHRYSKDLTPNLLAKMEPVELPMRDGTTIPGYLTKPAGSGPYPTVILPHGGPTARDYLRYDYWVQFLASRGYAVLQPNFRGSSGYGEAFEKAGGEGEWGLLMQDDVTDATQALIDRGIADPNRICIVGGSYGGYAALMGVAKEPDLYACAVSFAGVTDIPQILKEGSRFKFGTRNAANVGNYKTDREQFEKTSPVNNVDRIKVPVLIIHGEADTRVLVGHSKRFAAKMKAANKPHKLVILEGGDHFLSFERNRVRFLNELGAFLDQNL